ncbi:MAG: serine/threonine-protein kinase [Mariprofundaceae bacterium]|nr:serine/threonine-protein kinase [Mariprofundaceae bacterium]
MRIGENEPITLRYHRADDGDPVTLRFVAGQAAPIAATTPASSFTQGQRIAGRYQIMGESLAESGEADVFLCQDQITQATRVIKYYRQQARPKAAVIDRLQGLAHPNIVTILDYGQWHGRFYEVLDYCLGGVASDIMPMDEIRIRSYLPGILAALQYLHGEGIVHRDIKPGNLFFADQAHQRIMLGDFGISSYLDLAEESVRLTQTATCLTLDYASPELLNHHEIGSMTDYYALGITLLHLLRGRTPFYGMNNNDILVAHLRAEIPIPASLSDPFQTLIAGLTHYQTEERWGYREAMGWLHGEVVRLAPAPVMLNDGKKPYPALPEATTPAELAVRLNDMDALQHLLRGDIQRWLFDYFDPKQAQAVAELEVLAHSQSQLALAKLPFILDPKAPLLIGKHCIKNLGDLFRVLERPSHAVSQAWNNKAIMAWLEAGQHAGEKSNELLAKLERLHKENGHQTALSLFTLRYLLQPALPLHIGSLGAIGEPEAFMQLFRKHGKKIIAPLAKLIFSQRLEAWLQTVWSTASEPHLKFLRRVRMQYWQQQNIGAYCVLWHFCPSLPFPFDGQNFFQSDTLARYIIQDEACWQKGIAYLEAGWITAWLQGSAKIQDSGEMDQLLLDSTISSPLLLDTFLRLMNPDLPRPRMIVQPEFLKLGNLQHSEVKTRPLHIFGTGQGYLYGSIDLQSFSEGVMIDTFDFEGKSTIIQLTVDTVNLAPGRYENRITINSNAGTHTVDMSFTVLEKPTIPWWKGGF